MSQKKTFWYNDMHIKMKMNSLLWTRVVLYYRNDVLILAGELGAETTLTKGLAKD